MLIPCWLHTQHGTIRHEYIRYGNDMPCHHWPNLCTRYALAAIFLSAGFARRSSILGMVLQFFANRWCGSDRFHQHGFPCCGIHHSLASFLGTHPLLETEVIFLWLLQPFCLFPLALLVPQQHGGDCHSCLIQKELSCSGGQRRKKCRIACSNLWVYWMGLSIAIRSNRSVPHLVQYLVRWPCANMIYTQDRNSHSRRCRSIYGSHILLSIFLCESRMAGSDVSKGFGRNPERNWINSFLIYTYIYNHFLYI